jgi:inosose dehydratase
LKVALHTAPWNERFAEAWAGAREAGYRAVETFCLSQWFGKPSEFRAILDDFGLALAGMECGGEWITPERAAVEQDSGERLARFLAEVGADVMVVSGGRRPKEGVDLESYAAFSEVMSGLGETCRSLGVRLCFHPKRGTIIEYRDQIGMLMDGTDPDLVSLCLDTGELALSGCDPLEVFRAYGPRVGHIHLKDLDWHTHRPVTPGKGALELDVFLEELKAKKYGGWMTVELDQTPDPINEGRTAWELLASFS